MAMFKNFIENSPNRTINIASYEPSRFKGMSRNMTILTGSKQKTVKLKNVFLCQKHHDFMEKDTQFEDILQSFLR